MRRKGAYLLNAHDPRRSGHALYVWFSRQGDGWPGRVGGVRRLGDGVGLSGTGMRGCLRRRGGGEGLGRVGFGSRPGVEGRVGAGRFGLTGARGCSVAEAYNIAVRRVIMS
jgi:hypothetical protein